MFRAVARTPNKTIKVSGFWSSVGFKISAVTRFFRPFLFINFLPAGLIWKTFCIWSFTEDMFKEWYIANPSGIAMGEAAKSYTTFERKVAQDMDPIYLLIAMIPCEKLWHWLAVQIRSGIVRKSLNFINQFIQCVFSLFSTDCDWIYCSVSNPLRARRSSPSSGENVVP